MYSDEIQRAEAILLNIGVGSDRVRSPGEPLTGITSRCEFT
jgi:hypothetical protein